MPVPDARKPATDMPATDVPVFDLLNDPAVHWDPYPTYASLRRRGAVVPSGCPAGYYIVTGYDEMRRVLLDPHRFSNRRTSLEAGETAANRFEYGSPVLINTDDPDHAAQRALLAPLFTPQRAKAAEPRFRRAIADVLDDALAAGWPLEFVSQVAVPYIGRAFLPTLGVPEGEVDWMLRAMLGEAMVAGRAVAVADRARAAAAEQAMRAEVAAWVLARVGERGADAAPDDGDDILDVLARARRDGASDAETVNFYLVVVTAGLQTTIHSLGNMVLFLSEHPEHRRRLVADPGITARAAEELMRYESIVTEARVVNEEVELGGVRLCPGDLVALPLASAGRDEAKFGDRADEVDFDRRGFSHLQFGLGIHRCLGMHFARLEIRVALEELHRRLPDYRRTPHRPLRRHTGQGRGTDELWLVPDPADALVNRMC